MEYTVGVVAWRCNRFDLLAAEFDQPPVTPDALATWHALAVANERAWLACRRLFGLMPVQLPPDFSPDDMRPWTRAELLAALGWSAAQLTAELEAVRGMWRGMEAKTPNTQAPEIPKGGNLPAEDELALDTSPLLIEHNFQVAFESAGEREYFLGRVTSMEKLLNEKMTSGLARNALMTELQIKRVDESLANPRKVSPGGQIWRQAMETRQKLAEDYRKQMAELDRLAPWARAVGGKYVGAGVLSDVTQAMQEYYAQGDTRLADGMFTALEIHVELRRSLQMPMPRYRAGVVFFVNMARVGLFDPRFQSEFAPRVYKMLDAGWRERAMEVDEAPPVDLLKDGPEGEYPELPNGEKTQRPNGEGTNRT